MKYFKIVLIYIALSAVVSQLFSHLLADTWLHAAGGYLGMLIVFAMMCNIAKHVSNNLLKKRLIVYSGIIIGAIMVLQLTSAILVVETRDTWLGAIGGMVIFLTMFVVLFDLAEVLQGTNEKLSASLQLISAIGLIVVILVGVLSLVL